MSTIDFYNKRQKTDNVMRLHNGCKSIVLPVYAIAFISKIFAIYGDNIGNPNLFLVQCHNIINEENIEFGEYLGISQDSIINESNMDKILNKIINIVKNLLAGNSLNFNDDLDLLDRSISLDMIDEIRFNLGDLFLQQLAVNPNILQGQTFTNMGFNIRDDIKYSINSSIYLDNCELTHGKMAFYQGMVVATGNSELFCMSVDSYGVVKDGAKCHIHNGAYGEAYAGGEIHIHSESSSLIGDGGIGHVYENGFAYLYGGKIENNSPTGMVYMHTNT